MLNPKRVWYKTHIVNSPTFGRFVFELENFGNKAAQCFNNMSKARALVIASQIADLVESFNYSIDAKSSESLRDKNNTQTTLIDKINRYRIEKAYHVKGEMKKSFMDGMLGRDGQQEADND